MANNINREGFKRFLELGAPSFEGNIILDSGELSEYYYRFMRIPLAYGEHKVDVLYGQRFYGTLENKPVTFNQEIRFLCLVVDNARTVTESFLPGARPARNCLTSMSRSHKIAEFAFNTANLCMTGSCLRAAPFFVPFSLHILANRIDWYLGRCFHP